jgi:ABC-type amino acid transport substrate-binding protein
LNGATRAAASLGLAVMLAGSFHPAPARAEDTLKVCLGKETPPYSFKHGAETGGFDLAVAQALAKRLGRTLVVQWFETERDLDSDPTLEANALLSDGLCQLIGGYPLYADALGKPSADKARLPSYEGGKFADRRRWVALGVLQPSRAYHFAPLAVVLGGAALGKHITGLKDLAGLRLGAEQGSLPDSILMTFDDGKFVDQVIHVVPGRSQLLEELEAGRYDATLIELQRFDVYRGKHPETKLALSGYYHRYGFNMGFVGLASEAALMSATDKVIEAMLAEGVLPPMAQAAGMTFLPPRQPEIRATIPLGELSRE